jgi:glycosyltransferase involved in cell wall biosynthesis
MLISIVIPVFNSEQILPELVLKLEKVLKSTGRSFELILINDDSHDHSWEVITRLCDSHSWLRGINLMRNYGQHNAVLCGIQLAQGDVIITMDDDLQHPPETIPLLLEQIDLGYDVVYGTPRKEQQNFWRNMASRLTKMTLQNTMGAETASKVGPLRAIRAQVCLAFRHFQSPDVNIDSLLTWGTTRFAAVPVDYAPRLSGKSNYTLRKLIGHAINMTTGFSTLPLRITSILGFLFTIFGIFVLIYVIGKYLIWGGSPAGFPFLASTIAIFSGAQLFALGIIGEYLARMYNRSMERPPSIIRDKIGFIK